MLKESDVDHNVYFATEQAAQGAEAVLQGLRRYGSDAHSIVADPGFVDLENGDYRLREDSPALGLGIRSIDVSEMGLTDELPRWSQ